MNIVPSLVPRPSHVFHVLERPGYEATLFLVYFVSLSCFNYIYFLLVTVACLSLFVIELA